MVDQRVRVCTDEGLTGVGSGDALDGFAPCAGLLVGEDPLRLARQHIPPRPDMVLGAGAVAGTGTETNSFAVIDDPVAGCKRYVGHPSALPRYAILDPALGASAPPLVTAACGVDVLAHAVEAAQARAGNAYAAGLAGEAARIVFASLPGVVSDGAGLEGRSAMLMAAHLAGLAFATTGLGTAHAVGHALSARHGAAHGFALAAILPGVVALNAVERPHETARLAEAAGLGDEPLAAAVVRLLGEVGLTPSLSDLGVVGAESLAGLADAALADEVILNAPRIPGRDELVALLAGASSPGVVAVGAAA